MKDPVYLDAVIDHFHAPRNRGRIEAPDASASRRSDACGDWLHVTLTLDDEVVDRVCFDGEGCAISQATASIASDHLRGRTVTEILGLPVDDYIRAVLGDRVSVSRRPCAALSLQVIQAALGAPS